MHKRAFKKNEESCSIVIIILRYVASNITDLIPQLTIVFKTVLIDVTLFLDLGLMNLWKFTTFFTLYKIERTIY